MLWDSGRSVIGATDCLAKGSCSVVPTGLRFIINAYPALKRWAILFRAYGACSLGLANVWASSKARAALVGPESRRRGGTRLGWADV